MYSLLKFFRLFLALLSPDNAHLHNIFPRSVQCIRQICYSSVLWLIPWFSSSIPLWFSCSLVSGSEKNGYTEYVVCPQCFKLYDYAD